MNRRNFLSLSAAPLLAQPTQRPNILFLLTDDQRWDALGCMGHPFIQTPEVDALARRGVVFENNFCATAICMTSRASIFTGLHSRSHGIHEFTRPLSADDHRQSYHQVLRRNGYHTGFIGKYGVGDRNPLPTGDFDYFKGFDGQGVYYPKSAGGKKHLTNIMGEQAVEFLNGAPKSKPFCLQISYKAPHAEDPHPDQFVYDTTLRDLYKNDTVRFARTFQPSDFAAQPEFLRTSEGRVRWEKRFRTPELAQEMARSYFRLITGVDRTVGLLRRELERLSLAQNTVIVYTSDNGMLLGEHGLTDKWFPFEESIRTPLVIFDPRRPAKPRRSRAMTLNVDIAPTLVDIAGLPIPAGTQGRSLKPLLDADPASWRSDFYYEHLFKTSAVKIPTSEAIRTTRHKYIRYLEEKSSAEALFDLQSDPLEEKNLIADPSKRQVLSQLKQRKDLWTRSLDAWKRDGPWSEPLPNLK